MGAGVVVLVQEGRVAALGHVGRRQWEVPAEDVLKLVDFLPSKGKARACECQFVSSKVGMAHDSLEILQAEGVVDTAHMGNVVDLREHVLAGKQV